MNRYRALFIALCVSVPFLLYLFGFFSKPFYALSSGFLSPLFSVFRWMDGQPDEEGSVRFLEDRVRLLQVQLSSAQELEEENLRLRELLDFQKGVDRPAVAARVIGSDTNLWRKSVMVDRGREQGVQERDAVICAYGLVGMVVRVGQSVSQVMLLTDPNFRVSARLQDSRYEGVVQGLGRDDVEMNYVDKDGDVRVQDTVISSGLGDIFPKGLVIGGVSEVMLDESSLYYRLKIEPSVDFSRLEEVVILKHSQEMGS